MQSWVILAIVAIALAAALKGISHSAASTKRRLAAANGHDPIVDFFAWLDRKTSFHRQG
jgi:hypothetical protein